MLQNVDLADGAPMFITVGDREIAVIDAKAFRALQDKAARWDARQALWAKYAQHQPVYPERSHYPND